jgi:hypothetical protein
MQLRQDTVPDAEAEIVKKVLDAISARRFEILLEWACSKRSSSPGSERQVGKSDPGVASWAKGVPAAFLFLS